MWNGFPFHVYNQEKIRKERTDNFGKNKKTTYHVNTNGINDIVFLQNRCICP